MSTINKRDFRPAGRSTAAYGRSARGAGWMACLLLLLVAPARAQHTAPGASAPQEPDVYSEPDIDPLARDYWAFAPLTVVAPPQASDVAWRRGAIDGFVLDALERREMAPSPPADRRTLARRAHFDLTGLPPSSEALDAFLHDAAPDAYERLVDRLLGSPAYGQRWAQFWLDLARFAETDGFELDQVRPEAWRYRDWVVDALNQDLPFDRFVEMQLAGDEGQAEDSPSRAATGFCLAGPDMPDINSQVERRHQLLNEMTSTVSSALLGLQMECAQCHDHKYDPLSQADFYRLRAAFSGSVTLKRYQSISFLTPGAPDPADAIVLLRGDWRRPGPEAPPAVPRVLVQASAEPPSIDLPGGRRTALARWIVQHPLFARVAVNRIWQGHFGQGLSRTPSDFGVMGDQPSHPELLDWLAAQWPRWGWSLKELHRQIMLSAVYRQQSDRLDGDPGDHRGRERDPDNRFLWCFPRQRLDAESIRDALLAVSGKLVDRVGGPGVRPPLAPELVSTLLKDQWSVSPDPLDHCRRSIYVFARRNLRLPILEAFDRPDANVSCARRHESIHPSQALLLMNSPLIEELSQALAQGIHQSTRGSVARVDEIFRRALGRPASPGEQSIMLRALRDSADPTGESALADLCLAVLNASEFQFID